MHIQDQIKNIIINQTLNVSVEDILSIDITVLETYTGEELVNWVIEEAANKIKLAVGLKNTQAVSNALLEIANKSCSEVATGRNKRGHIVHVFKVDGRLFKNRAAVIEYLLQCIGKTEDFNKLKDVTIRYNGVQTSLFR